MDIIKSNTIWLIIAGTTVIAFTTYSVLSIRKHGARTYCLHLGNKSLLILLVLGKFMIKALHLLARSVRTSQGNEITNNAARGGVYNYRTRKFDDGTDPAGLYDED